MVRLFNELATKTAQGRADANVCDDYLSEFGGEIARQNEAVSTAD